MTDRYGNIEYNNYEVNNMTNTEFESFINLRQVIFIMIYHHL